MTAGGSPAVALTAWTRQREIVLLTTTLYQNRGQGQGDRPPHPHSNTISLLLAMTPIHSAFLEVTDELLAMLKCLEFDRFDDPNPSLGLRNYYTSLESTTSPRQQYALGQHVISVHKDEHPY